MNTETTAAILLATLNECRRSDDPLAVSPSRIAKAQADALAKAAEGTIAISIEGLPSREELLGWALAYSPHSLAAVVLTRVAEAMPEPALPLPIAPWSVVTDPDGDPWVLGEDGMWCCGGSKRTPEGLVKWCGPLIVRHDAGADQ